MSWIKNLFGCGGKLETGYKVADDIPWPEAPTPVVDKYAEEEARVKKIQEQIDELNANDNKLEIGDFVKYTKIPNDIIMGVAEYIPYRIGCSYYRVGDGYDISIDSSRMAAQYFVNGELKTIVDSPKWFEKVEKE